MTSIDTWNVMIFNSGYNLNPCGWTERYRAAIQPRRVLIALLTRWINVSLPHSSPLHDRPEPKKQDVQTLKRNLALWLRVGPLWQRNLLLFFFFFFCYWGGCTILWVVLPCNDTPRLPSQCIHLNRVHVTSAKGPIQSGWRTGVSSSKFRRRKPAG